MSNMKYVIRRNEFGYNDEWYQTDHPTLGAIQAIYIDQAEAEKAYKSLVVDALYNEQDLCQYDICNGDAADGLYEKIEAFILEKTGETFDGESLPKMNENDAFEFAKISGILCYQLIEVDDSKPNYAIWINHENEYLRNYDSGSVIFDSHEDFLEYHDDRWIFDHSFGTVQLKGNLATLSDSPQLLETFIASSPRVEYDPEQEVLSMNTNVGNTPFKEFKALNALLKQPLFEIRPLTLEQIQTL